MYKSPIEIVSGNLSAKIENEVLTIVQSYGVAVDKHELIRALAYDRDQYNRGFNDGIMAAADELVRCKDCTHRHSSEFCECRPEDAFCSDGERRSDD